MLMIRSANIVTFLTAVSSLTLATALDQRTNPNPVPVNITFDNAGTLGQLPAALVPVNVPSDDNGDPQFIRFISFAYNNIDSPIGAVEPNTPPLVASTNLRVALVTAILNVFVCDFIPEKGILPRLTIDYDNSPASSFSLKELYLVTGAATGAGLTGQLVSANISFTAIKAGEGREVAGVHYAQFEPGTTGDEKQQMMRVKFPNSFTALKDVEMRIVRGPFFLPLLNDLLIALLIDSVSATVVLK